MSEGSCATGLQNGIGILGGRLAAVAVMLVGIMGSSYVLANDSDRAFWMAMDAAVRNHLIANTSCVALVTTVAGKRATVDFREVHNAKCGGDPDLEPRLFSMIIDLKTGKASSDDDLPSYHLPYYDGEFRPLPLPGRYKH